MSVITEHRVGPGDVAPEEQARLDCMAAGEARLVLLTGSGDVIEFPKALNEFFLAAVQAIKERQAVFLMHEDEEFTTQEAADFLGVSRQYLVRLLDEEKIRFHSVGTHRRVLLKDLVAFQQTRSQQRRAILDKMTEEVVAAGLDDRYVDLTRPANE